MSLSRKFLSNAALSTSLVFGAVSAPALADVPAVGQCGPAEDVKNELTKAGQFVLVAYDSKYVDQQTGKIKEFRESLYADASLARGYSVGRRGANNEELCIGASTSDIVLADTATQARVGAVDPRFYKQHSDAAGVNGLNLLLDSAAKNVSAYPMIQARIKTPDGGQGYLTIISHPVSREGEMIVTSLSGKASGFKSLEAGERNGVKYGPQYSQVAKDTMASPLGRHNLHRHIREGESL